MKMSKYHRMQGKSDAEKNIVMINSTNEASKIQGFVKLKDLSKTIDGEYHQKIVMKMAKYHRMQGKSVAEKNMVMINSTNEDPKIEDFVKPSYVTTSR